MSFDEEENIQLFKTIFDQTPISTQVFTPNGDTILVNKAWEKLWNVKFSQVKTYNILKDKQLIETGTMPFIKKGFKGEMVSIPPITYVPQKTINVKGATTRWLSAKMYPIKNLNGKITHIVLQHEDITERKISQEALEESKEKFRILTSHAPVGIFMTDKDGNCLFVNERWCKLAGMSKEEAMGTGWTNALHPEDKEDVYKEWYESAKEGREFTMQYRFMTPKRKVTWLSGTAVAIKDKKKNVTGYIGTVADITDRKLAIDLLQHSEERLRLALDAGKIGVWDWDLANNELTWTDNVYEIHGVSKSRFKVNLENFQKIIHPDDRGWVLKQIDKSLKDREEFHIEFRVMSPRGEVRWVTTSAIVSYDKNEKPIRMLGATSDITHKKQIEQEKTDFIGMASHELKTPITSMKMFAELLYKELQNANLDKPLRFATRIREQTNRLAELTSDLLDVSRIEAGKLQLKKETLNLAELIRDSVEGLQTTTRHELILKELPEAFVVADRYRLYQVLVNLITNAVKYSPNSKKIVLRLQKIDNEAVVSVKDFGIGIAKGKQAKIFERLYQVTDSKLKTYPGLGLGLYISKEIMERHKGKLWLKSERGKGSTFYFSLNLAK